MPNLSKTAILIEERRKSKEQIDLSKIHEVWNRRKIVGYCMTKGTTGIYESMETTIQTMGQSSEQRIKSIMSLSPNG